MSVDYLIYYDEKSKNEKDVPLLATGQKKIDLNPNGEFIYHNKIYLFSKYFISMLNGRRQIEIK